MMAASKSSKRKSHLTSEEAKRLKAEKRAQGKWPSPSKAPAMKRS